MRASDAYLIKGFPLFRGISDAAFDRVTADAVISDVQPGTVLVREGEKPSSLFVLLGGLAEAFSESNGKRVIVTFLRPPAAFILAAVWLDQVQLNSVRTSMPSRVLSMSAQTVRDAIASDASFAAAAGYELAIRYRDVMKELKNQRLRSATERLANWLLTESRFAGMTSFTLGIGKAVLASRLGMTGEHLSRAFAQLREHGVEIAGNDVRIEPDRLAVFASPTPLIDGVDL
ncbi:cyclic nucleotide-binding domain-containing protein [Alsobacter sp. SYSU M60028]|uniref:Cyclic nucleotide-binding domain-containing protein n=1 Tax=Alsobacter ponti TaxID=2962936 RepID=A0ABT1LFQ8_9HYPH|nr:cyclic nucleotide-binding domain-containing protein [Alsobacter ponti]MCP8939560.1 cyclic nucleotide-binding domain-containing protein [Alsobacter ponti]